MLESLIIHKSSLFFDEFKECMFQNMFIYFDIENNFSFTLTGIRERVEIFEWSYKGCRKWAR